MLDLFTNKYPYTSFHELNLDWLISKVIAMNIKLDNFVSVNTIKYADPIGWDITKQYEANTVVLDQNTGIAYLSSQPVPVGVSISNPDYWSVIFDLQQIIGSINENITYHNDGTSPTATFILAVGDWVLWNSKLYKVIQAISPGYAYIEGSNIEAHSVEDLVKEYVNTIYRYVDTLYLYVDTLVGDLNDLTTSDISSVVNAINSLVTDLSTAVYDINNTIGNITTLTTSDTSSVVNAINSLVTDLTNAVNTIDNTIGDLNTLTTTDKTSVVNAINEVATYSGKLIVYNPSGTFGLDNTGATDCSAILAGISDNVGLKSGTYLISANCTISCNVLIPEGAIFNIPSGVVVTFNGYIDAGLYQIFTGAGSVKFIGNTEAYPEWFGAKRDLTTDDAPAIQKALDSLTCGAVVLQAGKYNLYQDAQPTVGYRTESTIVIDDSQSDISIKCLSGKAVICPTVTIGISLEGSTDNSARDYITHATLENIILYYVGNITSASAYNVTIGIRVHGLIWNRFYSCEVYNFLTCIYSDTIIVIGIEDCTLQTINTIYSCCVYLNDNVINNALYPNASVHINNCILHGGANSIGVLGNGAVLSDLFIRNNEFGGFYEAVSLTLSSDVQPMVSALDIHITDNIMDNVRRGIDIFGGGIHAEACHIGGNWIANTADYCILLRAMYNATIEGNILNGVLSSNSYQIALISCRHATIQANTLNDFRVGISFSDVSYASACGNILQSAKDLNTTAIEIVNSTRNNISNNTIMRSTGGSMTNAISLTGTENVINWNIKQPGVPNSIATGNIVDGASI